MKRLAKNRFIIGATIMAMMATISLAPIMNPEKSAFAAQGCLPGSVAGTVSVNGVPTDGATVTLRDITQGFAPFSTVTAQGGLYQVDLANLDPSLCVAIGDQLEVTATQGADSTATTTAYGGEVIVMINLNIIPVIVPVLTTIGVAPANPSVTEGGMLMFTATPRDQLGNPMNVPVNWQTSNAMAGTIDASGMFMAMAAGTSTISAVSGPISGTTTVTVNPLVPVVTTITVSPANPTISAAGGIQQFTATAFDQIGNQMNPQPAFTWTSSNQQIATVTAAGLATGLSAGTSTITASSGPISGSALLTAVAQALTAINVTPSTTSILTGTTQQFAAQALDQFGAAMNPQPAFAWSSSNQASVTIDPISGLATGISVGTTSITALSGAISGTASLGVTLAPPVLTSISVTPATSTIIVGASLQFSANALDQYGNTLLPQPAFTWNSTNPAAAMVDANGLVMSMAVGTTTISATSGAVSGSTLVTAAIIPQVLTSISVTPATSTATLGTSTQFSATAFDQFGAAMNPQPAFTWSSSNQAAATISASGLMTPQAVGTTTVVATSGTTTGNTIVTIASPANPIDNAAPLVDFVNPANLMTGQNLDRSIYIVFTKYNIDTATLNSQNITLTDNQGNPVPAALVTGCCNRIATFVPAVPLQASTTYTVNLTTGIKNLAGVAMAQPYSWSFSTAPTGTIATTTIEFTNPLANGTDFPIDRMIHLIFNKKMDVASVNANTYYLRDALGNTVNVMYMSRGGGQFMLVPHMNMNRNASYTVFVTTGVKDAGGTPLSAPYSWSFTTGNTVNLHPKITAIPELPATAGQAMSYQVLATDPNGDPITYSLIGAPAGLSIGSSTGMLSWTPAAVGRFSFDIQASDGQSSGVLRNVTINVGAVPTPPPSGGGGGGGGFPLPTTVTTSNAPLTIQPTENGILEQTLEDGLKVVVNIPAGAVTSKTTFRVTRGQLTDLTETEKSDKLRPIEHSLFNLTAVNEAGQSVTNFAKAITITVSGVELPSDVVNLSVYAFDEGRLEWLIVPGALFNSSAKSFTFSINHLTLFGIFRSPGLPSIIKPVKKIEDDKKTEDERQKAEDRRRVLGIKIYPDGTLIRGTDNRIYVIMFGEKERIVNMAELSLYRGKPIIRVDAATLSSYDEHKFAKLRNGDLFRGPDNRIYVIKNGKKQHIRSLIELRQYHGKKINNVDTATVAHY